MRMRRLLDSVRSAREILLTTHQAPDGDGIGSELGLMFVLEGLAVRVHAFIDGEVPDRLRHLPGAQRLRNWAKLAPAEQQVILAAGELGLVVDTHDWSLAGPLGEALRTAGFPTLFLDHHPPAAPGRPEVFSDPQASSTGELAWRLARELTPQISGEAATCFYAAIAYDTNSFKYLRGRAAAHRAAADLIDAGADAEAVYRHLFASRPPGKLALLARVLEGSARTDEGRIAWLLIRREWISSGQLCRDDLRDLVTSLLEIDGVEVAFTLQEEGPSLKLSLRSMGRVAVNGIARSLGGGGHLYAAAAQLTGTPEEAVRQVLGLIREQQGEGLAPSTGA
jgi:phosphoesterase RecJ-like protein